MNLANAPEKGMMYALYTDRVVYKKYTKENLPSAQELLHNLLELHLFDDIKEYRYIKKRSGELEVIIEDKDMIPEGEDRDMYCYTERIFTREPDTEAEGGIWQIDVVNYLSYNEDDLMTIPGYRLKEVKD